MHLWYGLDRKELFTPRKIQVIARLILQLEKSFIFTASYEKNPLRIFKSTNLNKRRNGF